MDYPHAAQGYTGQHHLKQNHLWWYETTLHSVGPCRLARTAWSIQVDRSWHWRPLMNHVRLTLDYKYKSRPLGQCHGIETRTLTTPLTPTIISFKEIELGIPLLTSTYVQEFDMKESILYSTSGRPNIRCSNPIWCQPSSLKKSHEWFYVLEIESSRANSPTTA